jgi:hypothetical protein
MAAPAFPDLTIRVTKERSGYFAAFSMGHTRRPESFRGVTPIAAIRRGLDFIERAAENQKPRGQPIEGPHLRRSGSQDGLDSAARAPVADVAEHVDVRRECSGELQAHVAPPHCGDCLGTISW